MTEETILKAQEQAKLQTRSSLPAWILIGTGLVLLLTSMLDLHLLDYIWPGFLIAPGLLMLAPAYKSTADDRSGLAFLAVPGAMFVTIGALLFVMNLFDHFEAWAYCWPLIPAAAAAGVLYLTRFDNNERLEHRAHKFIRLMAMLTAGLAFFFEIVVYENFNPLMSLGLILFGLYLLLKERRSVNSAGKPA
jgi:hypothetical protein